MIKYKYDPGSFSEEALLEFLECEKPKKDKNKPTRKQKEQGRKLAKEYGLQNQPKKKREEIAKKGGQAKRDKTRSDAKCEG